MKEPSTPTAGSASAKKAFTKYEDSLDTKQSTVESSVYYVEVKFTLFVVIICILLNYLLLSCILSK